MQIPVQDLLKTWLPHIGWGTFITTCLTLCGVLLKLGWKANGVVERQKKQAEQIELAMTNHLPHIQAASERTAAAVEKIADATIQTKVALAEMNGYLKGKLD